MPYFTSEQNFVKASSNLLHYLVIGTQISSRRYSSNRTNWFLMYVSRDLSLWIRNRIESRINPIIQSANLTNEETIHRFRE
jgi:hypothetical protein